MCYSTAKAKQDLTNKMLVFPRECTTDYVKLTPSQERFTAVTVCHRTFTDLRRDHGLFSLAVPCASNGFLTFMTYCPKTLGAYIYCSRAQFGAIDYAPNKWHSICTTWDSKSGQVQMWLDGKKLNCKCVTQKPICGKPIITLGQEQDCYGGGFDAKQSFVGKMTDVHMWDYVLSPCEIQKYMAEQHFTPGNVVNWGALEFEMKGCVRIENKETGCTCSTNP